MLVIMIQLIVNRTKPTRILEIIFCMLVIFYIAKKLSCNNLIIFHENNHANDYINVYVLFIYYNCFLFCTYDSNNSITTNDSLLFFIQFVFIVFFTLSEIILLFNIIKLIHNII